MRDELRAVPLTFPLLTVGAQETPPDLTRLVYREGALLRVDQAAQAIERGVLGDIITERLDLVRAAHEFIAGELAAGGSSKTARDQIKGVVRLFAWAERSGATLSMSEVQKIYLDWSEHLLQRVRVAKDLSQSAAHTYARITGQVLDAALGRQTPLIELTRIRRPPTQKTPQGAKADKQRLEETFAFGHLLQAVCDGLTVDVIRGPRIASIPLRSGRNVRLICGRTPGNAEEREAYNVRASEALARAYESDRSLNHGFRQYLVNFRIHAEMLVFIAQTGMNLAQAQTLPLRRFSYTSDIDGYTVTEYKRRRRGDVQFQIFSEYRSHFERYLAWCRELFPGSPQLFPLIRRRGACEDRRPSFGCIQSACKNAGISWVPPATLRGTRVNWLLRRSGDPDLAADLAQNDRETLVRVYERPSLQRAFTEITRFWHDHDPALAATRPVLSTAPGACDGNPVASRAIPKGAPAPDCVHPSGCLWCDHHRDIDSQDYVWSLACFRHLKILEKSKYCVPSIERCAADPADHTIGKISEKLSWYRGSNATRREWVEEALARVEEGAYHEQWAYLIANLEGSC
jgi:hypothetical protein